MTTNEEQAVKPWKDKGCAVCRQQWLSGPLPPQLAASRERHTMLHCCPVCHTLWEQTERYATDISREEAIRIYGEAVLKGSTC